MASKNSKSGGGASRPARREGEREIVSPVEIVRPASWTSPFIFASPHSGRRYAASFLRDSLLDLVTLRRSEDSYVDLLVDTAPELGAPLVKALFPRAFVDVNRDAGELDPAILSGKLPAGSDPRSNRVLAGFGVIPRLAADGLSIYGRKLPVEEAQARLDQYYHPYHTALKGLVEEARRRFGCAILIDCHSMPSRSAFERHAGGRQDMDFILGTVYGTSCAPALVGLVQGLLVDAGYRVGLNTPYAGGYVTRHYGQPEHGVHALQIEINRRLYLDENRITRTAGFSLLRSALKDVFTGMVGIDPQALYPRQAAE